MSSGYIGDNQKLYTQTKEFLLREIARVFKNAAPADRCWLADKIAEARRRIHARQQVKDDVDQAIEIMEGK